MKRASVFKRVILFRLLHSAYSHHSLLLLFGALVILSCRWLVAAKILHQRFHLIPDLWGFLGVMLLGIVEVSAITTAMNLAAILLFEIFLRGSRNWAVLRGMMVKFHSHALQLDCFLWEPLMFFLEFMLISLFGIFPLMSSSVQSWSILRCGLSVLMSLLATKVKSGDSKLFLLSSESQWESFLI